MIHCKELNKDFDSKQNLIKAIRVNKDIIISDKKSRIYKSCEKGQTIIAKPIDPLKFGTTIKGISIDNEYYYIAVNATKILDSHSDLHQNGLWNKTVKDQQGQNYLVDTHILSVNTTIARKEHIEMFTADIPFSLLGKPYSGNTEALIYKVRKDKIISIQAKEWLESGDDIEASVRMQYIDILFALNSDDKEDVKFKANYDKYHKEIANINDFDTEIIYFWIVKQAKNIQESSLVLFASNTTTGQITENSKIIQPPEGTDINTEPLKSTQPTIEELWEGKLKYLAENY